MAITIDASILNALSTSLSAAFTRGVGRINPQFRSVATVVPSSGASNTYGWLDDFPGIKEWVSTRQLLTLKEMGYSITNKTWESSIKVKREKIEDDQLGQYSVIAEQFGRSVTMFPDSLVFKLLCDGFTTTCFDGQYFFDSDHPVGTGTASNVVGTPATDTGEPWFLVDATQALLPIIFQDRRPFDFKALDDLDNEHTFTNNEFLFGTRDDLLAVDGSLVWNMAIDKSTQQLDEAKIETAIDDADAEINSFLAKRFQLPLNIAPIPRPLHRVAVSIAIYWLSERDSQITDLIQKRYDEAIRTLKEIANGTRDLGLPTATQPPETDSGKIIIVSDNERLFTRNKLRGVL